MNTSRFFAPLFVTAAVLTIALVLVHVVQREQPGPAQLSTGGPKTFTEDFSSTSYRDINYSTASWDTSSGTLSIPTNRTEARALSLSIDSVSDSIEAATLSASFVDATGTAQFYLSNDNGLTYVPVIPGQEKLFTTSGDQLKWKTELTRSDGAAPVLDSISITYRTRVPDHLVHVSATDPIHLGIEASKLLFSDGSADAVVLGRADDVIDTFVATPLARAKNASLLFTSSDGLSPETRDEITRVVSDRDSEIVIVGGPAAVSASVVSQLQQAGFARITRLGGATRYETAEQIAEAVVASNTQPTQHAFITEARFLADAYSASAPAARFIGGSVAPIILLEREQHRAHPATVALLQRHPEIKSATVVGGSASIPEQALVALRQHVPALIVSRQAGIDRFATNDAVVRSYFDQPAVVAITDGKPTDQSGVALYSPLVASLLAAYGDGPLLFVQAGLIPPAQVNFLYEQAPSISKVFVIGDITGDRPEVLEQLYNLISRS